ncbi:MAG TPA: hypothetical protein VFO77_12345, partial [Actinoplanes sp.]|nr:hypothetical protein [Actinoplanes sp.]
MSEVRGPSGPDVVLLTLEEPSGGGCGTGGSDGGCCGGDKGRAARVPVLVCADALTAAGARVELVT